MAVPPRLTLSTLALTPTSPLEPSGSWDSIHVFETMERGRQAHYKLTSTIMLQLITRRGSTSGSSDAKEPVTWTHDGEISLSGSMTRQVCFSVCGGGSRNEIRMTDGARSSCAGCDITRAKRWEDGRGYGN
jgi:F-actin capping protein, beta subunit